MRVAAVVLAISLNACGGSSDSGSTPTEDSASASDSGAHPSDGGSDVVDSSTTTDGPSGEATTDASDASADAGPPVDSIDANRDRLLGTYYDYLKSDPSKVQSNGLSGAGVSSVCDLWNKMHPSDRDVFLTITARLQGSKLGTDGSSMLVHVTKLYRCVGGQGATTSDPGSCGGGEYNRMIMSEDDALHIAQLAANTNKGAKNAAGKYDIADVIAGGFWRDSHDLGGPHAPFDLSDETNDGAPRGQTQYFADVTSSAATSPLGRLDLETLVDPKALEMDEDYDCVHNSNPSCSYTTYGAFCLPGASTLGTALFTSKYGDYGPGWMPTGCTKP